MAINLQADVLIDGAAAGEVLRLAEPISFWGGVNAKNGRIVQPAHPDFDRCLTGRILVLPGAIGSSSSSAIMLELIREAMAPIAVVMAETDVILALGVVIAGELDLPSIPVLRAPIDAFETGMKTQIMAGGQIRLGAEV